MDIYMSINIVVEKHYGFNSSLTLIHLNTRIAIGIIDDSQRIVMSVSTLYFARKVTDSGSGN